MLDESIAVKTPEKPSSGHRIDWAKEEWEKSERAFRHSVALLCGIIESESRSFPEGKMIRIEAGLRTLLARDRALSRRDLARFLQDRVNGAHAEIVADWWCELGSPATAHAQESIVRFHASVNEITRQVRGVSSGAIETQLGEDEGPLLSTAVGEGLRLVRPGWFRKHILRQAISQLRTDAEATVTALGRRLIEQIQRRAACVRTSLRQQLDQALVDARESERSEGVHLLFAMEQPACKSAMLLPLGPPIGRLGILCHGSFCATEAVTSHEPPHPALPRQRHLCWPTIKG
jgi:hypothetical protein